MTDISPQPKNDTPPFLMLLYLVVLAAIIIYVVYYYGVTFDNHTEDELVRNSYYFVPAFFFSIVGLITKKHSKSILFAIGASLISAVLLVAFFMGIWPTL